MAAANALDLPEGEDDARDVLVSATFPLTEKLEDTPASTLAGAREQVAHVHATIEHSVCGERERLALGNALATLDALIGRAAAGA